MTDISDRYRRNSHRFLDTIATVPDGSWDQPSPCEDWSARDVVQHVVDTQGMFLGFVGVEPVALPSCAEDPHAAATAAFAQVQAGLDDPVVAATTFEGLLGPQTFAEAVDRFLSFDLSIHRWDLARAIGQDAEIDEAELDRLERSIAELGDQPAMRGPGGFGPELTAPEGASRRDRVLAFLGRAT